MRYFLIPLLIVTFVEPAMAEDSPAVVEIIWIQEADELLLEAREPRPCPSETDLPCERIWRIYGDGRLELVPGPSWLESGASIHPVLIQSKAVGQLLLELDQLLDLPARETMDQPPTKGPYLRLFLKRYRTADWSVAKDYWATLLVDDLEPVFSHLRAMLRWLSYREQVIVFRSGNPWPEICRAGRRAELGIRTEAPMWCRGLMRRSGLTFRGAGGRLESDETSPFSSEDRNRIRERLRERLRNLPRGAALPPVGPQPVER